MDSELAYKDNNKMKIDIKTVITPLIVSISMVASFVRTI